MTPTFRRAGPDDAAAVRALTRLAYARWVPVMGREPMPMTADYERAVREHIIDLVVRNGQLVALIETVLRNDDLLIENVAVDPDCQGQGLGDALLAQAERVAREGGRTVIRLYTNILMAANIGYYERRGFVRESEVESPFGRRVNMIRQLPASVA